MKNLNYDCIILISYNLDIESFILFCMTNRYNNKRLKNSEEIYKYFVNRDYNITNNKNFTWKELYTFLHNFTLCNKWYIVNRIKSDQEYVDYIQKFKIDITYYDKKTGIIYGWGAYNDINIEMDGRILKNNGFKLEGINTFYIDNMLIGFSYFEGELIFDYFKLNNTIHLKSRYEYYPLLQNDEFHNSYIRGISKGYCFIK